MKKSVKILVIATLAIMLFAGCNAGAGTSAAGVNQPAQLSVVGTGQVFVAPDIASISVGVQTKADTVSEAIALNTTQAKKIKDTIVAQGVNEEDIQTSNFYVYQQNDYDFQGAITKTYFAVDNTVYITVRDISNLGTLLDAVGRSGANNIYGVNFDVADKTAAQSTARDLAVQAAKAQAQELAQSAGVELGDLLSINSAATTTTPGYYGYGMGGGGGYAESVPISSGQMPINAQVVLTYAIK